MVCGSIWSSFVSRNPERKRKICVFADVEPHICVFPGSKWTRKFVGVSAAFSNGAEGERTGVKSSMRPCVAELVPVLCTIQDILLKARSICGPILVSKTDMRCILVVYVSGVIIPSVQVFDRCLVGNVECVILIGASIDNRTT